MGNKISHMIHNQENAMLKYTRKMHIFDNKYFLSLALYQVLYIPRICKIFLYKLKLHNFVKSMNFYFFFRICIYFYKSYKVFYKVYIFLLKKLTYHYRYAIKTHNCVFINSKNNVYFKFRMYNNTIMCFKFITICVLR